MTNSEPLPPEPEYTPLPHEMMRFAQDISNGQAGADYIYSLEEDYIYTYENNVWVRIFPKEFLDRINKKMPTFRPLSLRNKKEVLENFKINKHKRISEFNKTSLINFENCMFDTVSLQKFPHDKKHYSTIRIPYKYDPEAKCPLWIKTLEEIFEKNQNKMDLTQEFLGYCLSPDNEQKKGFLFLGETDTGKSTILDIVREVIGDTNISNVPLQHLANPQYTPLLINKMINIDPDINKNAKDYEREFKIITGGKNEKVSCNQKHIPTFEFVPKCKLILGANEFPKITDHSAAFYQRLIIVPCERRFQEHEKNRDLHSELVKELPGIFNWFISGLKRLKHRGSFERHEFTTEAIKELEDENHPSNHFFDDHIQISMGNEIEKGELFEKYQEWCKKNDVFTLNSAKFSTAVYKKFHAQTNKTCWSQDKTKRVWKNITYVPFKSHIEQTVSNKIMEEEI